MDVCGSARNAGGLNCWTNDTIRGYALKSGRLTPYQASDAVSNDRVLAIVRDRRDRLWIAADGGGLWQLQRGRVDRLEHHPSEAHGVRRTRSEDTEGNLWIAADGGGLHRIRDQRLDRRLTSRDGLPNDIVLALFEDRERNIWALSTREGLVRLRKGKFLVYTTRHGLDERLRHGAAVRYVTAACGSAHASDSSARARQGRAGRVQCAIAARRRVVPARRPCHACSGSAPVRDCSLSRTAGRACCSTAEGLRGNHVAALAEARATAASGSGRVRGWITAVKDGRVRADRRRASRCGGRHRRARGNDGSVWVGTDSAGLLQWKHGR